MRVVIGEDSALFREGLARLLEDAGHDVVAKADDAPSLVAAVTAEKPDLAVIDIRMPPDRTDDGARAARELRDLMPELGIVLLSQHVESRHSVDLVAGGYFGYLLKDRVFDVDDFLDALRRVAGGGSALDPEVVGTLMGQARAVDPLDQLTPREREVLALMAEGRTNSGIAVPINGRYGLCGECEHLQKIHLLRVLSAPPDRSNLCTLAQVTSRCREPRGSRSRRPAEGRAR